jgi:hypothetical protein
MGALEPVLAVGHAAILLPLEFFDDSLHLTVLASVAACPFHLLRRRASAAVSFRILQKASNFLYVTLPTAILPSGIFDRGAWFYYFLF